MRLRVIQVDPPTQSEQRRSLLWGLFGLIGPVWAPMGGNMDGVKMGWPLSGKGGCHGHGGIHISMELSTLMGMQAVVAILTILADFADFADFCAILQDRHGYISTAS